MSAGKPPAPEAFRNYTLWVALTRLGNWDLTRQRNAVPALGYKPLISVLVPVYDPERNWLTKALDSVMGQTYPHWELCICDDGSTQGYVREVLGLYERLDERIKVKYLDENAGIVRATNEALALTEGEFVGLLDHDDELASNALFEVVGFLQDRPDADLVYSDEDKIDEDGRRVNPHFKIGWSPDLAMSANYLNHFSVYRRTVLEEVGGWREGFDGAQDLELVQRYGERTSNIHHIPKVLYHWRKAEGSTAVGAQSKPYTHEKARRAVEDSLERRGVAGSVLDGFAPNTFRVEREITGEPRVDVILPSAGQPSEERLASLRSHTAYPNYRVFSVDTETGTMTEHPESGQQKVVKQLGRSSLSGLYNAAVRQADGEYAAILDPDLEAVSEGWLESMLQHAQRPEVGAVGARLLLPSGGLFQAGLLLDDGADRAPEAPRFYRYCDNRTLGHHHYVAVLTRNCSAVSSSCMMFRKDVFEGLGGFDEAHIGGEFADVDLCLRMRESGRLIVYTPYAELTYHGPLPRHSDLSPAEIDYIRERWGEALKADPYYNPNLAWDPNDLRLVDYRRWVKRRAGQPPTEEDGPTAADGARPTGTIRETVEVPPPFFIVGHGRSGTTWLELTLNSHPEVVCKGSGMFFGRGMPLYETQRTLPAALAGCEDLKTWHDMRPNYWIERSFEEDLPGVVKALADYTMGAELAESGKKIAGDRTPHHAHFLDEVHELYPEAKVIHVIRDGRDVAVSNVHAVWQNARDRGGPVDLEPGELERRDAYLKDREAFLGAGESIFTDSRIGQLSGSWNDAVRKGREDGRRLFGDNYAEVRYEALLDDPRRELARLFAFLGVDGGPEVVARVAEENTFEKVTGRPRGKEDPASFNRKGVAGDWREVFTERDHRVFEERAGGLLAELGYEKDEVQTPTAAAGEGPAGEPEKPAKIPPAPRRSRENPPFFVVGHGRSGTTWSERLLNSHPEVLCVGSGMFFGRSMGLFEGRKTLYSTLDNSEDLRVWHGMQPNYWSDYPFEDDLPGMVRAITDHVLYERLRKSGKKIVGDRTPHHAQFLDEVHELYPEAKIIHVIRDGRDVAISNVHAFWNSARDRGGPIDMDPEELERRDAYLNDREGFFRRGESIFTESRIDQLAGGWKRVVRKGQEDGRGLFGDNYAEVRYEALLDDPRHELGRLFAFLRVSQDGATLDRIVEENSFETKSQGRPRGEEDTTSFFRKGIHGDWKNVFNERDKRVFKQHAGDLLVRLGYETDLDW